ncbi:Uma2 family endonuclease [Tundrisphaera sp. TA3]|uniref:Uma2 family endonuclease n=1 Tax=Tundrisphaera sp. TA3 TaxID=3435775 RepID=UPI003EBA9E9D
MATASSTGNTHLQAPTGEIRTLIRGVGWEGYEALLDWFGDDSPRLSYARGNVEFMSPLNRHERGKKYLGFMIETIAEETGLDFASFGSTTLRRRDIDCGLEADECYYFAGMEHLSNTDRIDLEVEPPPDLCLEIEITNSLLPKLEIYALIGVPEIWRFDGKSITIFRLGLESRYVATERSLHLPFVPFEDLRRFLAESGAEPELTWRRRFRAWVREVLVPLHRDHPPGK